MEDRTDELRMLLGEREKGEERWDVLSTEEREWQKKGTVTFPSLSLSLSAKMKSVYR